MRIRPVVGVFAAALVILVGCGSANKTPSTSSTTPPTGTGPAGTGKLVRAYNLTLSGSAAVPPGLRAGSGKVTITLLGKQRLVCWSFTHLTGFDLPPTRAQINVGGKGKAGGLFVPLGVNFRPRACIREPATQIAAIANDPGGYYVVVESKKHPAGAVRSQL